MDKHRLFITVSITLLLAVLICGVEPGHAKQNKDKKAKISAPGITNAKKVMQSRFERDKKKHELKKQAYALRQQARRGK